MFEILVMKVEKGLEAHVLKHENVTGVIVGLRHPYSVYWLLRFRGRWDNQPNGYLSNCPCRCD
jgi:hypothetical protein